MFFAFQSHTTRRDFSFKSTKAILRRLVQLLKMIRIPSWNLPCTLNVQACPSPLGICHLFWKSCKCPTVGPGLHTENLQWGFKNRVHVPHPGTTPKFHFSVNKMPTGKPVIIWSNSRVKHPTQVAASRKKVHTDLILNIKDRTTN